MKCFFLTPTYLRQLGRSIGTHVCCLFSWEGQIFYNYQNNNQLFQLDHCSFQILFFWSSHFLTKDCWYHELLLIPKLYNYLPLKSTVLSKYQFIGGVVWGNSEGKKKPLQLIRIGNTCTILQTGKNVRLQQKLAKCTGDDSYLALITALNDDSDPRVRVSAAEALAKRKEPQAIEQPHFSLQ